MTKQIFLDVETKTIFDEHTKRDPALLGVSYVGIYERDEDRVSGFFEKDISNLWSILERAHRVVGYNIRRFDFPVLAAYYPGDIMKLPFFDMMEVIKERIGFSPRLDSLARATLGAQKSGSGLDAIRYFEEGRFDELASYCNKDVQLTYKLYAYAEKNGTLKYLDWKNEPVEFAISWDGGEESSGGSDIQMSLGV